MIEPDALPSTPTADALRPLLPLLSAFLDPLSDGLLIQDADLAFVFANVAAARLCGFDSPAALMVASTEEMFSRFMLLDATGQPIPHDALPNLRASADHPIIEETVRWRILSSGEERWSVVKTVWVPDGAGRFAYLVHIFRDITEQVHAEREVAAQQQRLTDIVMQAPAVMGYLEGPEHIIRLANPSYLRLFACDPIGKPLREARPELAARGIVEVIDRAYAAGKPYIAIEVPIPIDNEDTGASEDAYFDVVYQPTRDAAGRVDGMLVHAVEVTEQVTARRRLEALIHNVSDIITLLGADGTVLYQSPSVERILGYRPDERIGKNIVVDVITHPDDITAKRGFLDDARMHPGVPVTGRFRLRHKAGGWRDIEAVGINLLDDAAVRAIVATYRDVTERRRRDEQQRFLAAASPVLAESLDYETTLQRVADLAVAGIADWCGVNVLTEAGTLESVAVAHPDLQKVALVRDLQRRYPPNRDDPNGAYAVLRSGKSRLLPVLPDDVLVAIARDAEDLHALRSLGFGSVIIVPLIARGRGLGTLTLVSATPGYFEAADLAFVEELGRRCALAIDNARLYQDARAAEERYRGLFAGVADAVLVTDAEGHYVDANPAMTALVGYTLDELRTMRIGDLSADKGGAREHRAGAMRAGMWRGEMELVRKDGTSVPVEGVITPLRLPTGLVTIAIWRDITERREREQQQQEFVSMVAHEMRTPLTVMTGYLALMRKQGVYNERRMETVLTQTRRLNRLVSDTLEVSRLAAGRMELHRQEVDLCAVVRQCVEEAREADDAHYIQLDMPAHALIGWWDADRVGQVMQNLLMNAVKYSPAGSAVHVQVGDAGDHAEVRVRDEGIGIPPEDLPRLFDRFYRAENAKGKAGMGLGLHITKALVEAHGGELTVESTLGVGSTFTVSLPRDAAPAAG